MRQLLRALGLGLVIVLTAGQGAGAARSADPIAACPDQTYEQPFFPWADPADYVVVPGGAFEAGGSDWTLVGSSEQPGNEPYHVHGPGDSTSLSIPGGASATSPATCATVAHPDLRLFVRNVGDPLAVLRVQALLANASGHVMTITIGAISAGPRWAPTSPIPIAVNVLAALRPDGMVPVAFRFMASAGGAFQIDDVYLDPYRSA